MQYSRSRSECGRHESRLKRSPDEGLVEGQCDQLGAIHRHLVKCLHVEYGRENRAESRPSPALRLILRANRWLVILFGAYLCNIDLQARLEDQNDRRCRQAIKWGPLKRSNWRRELKCGWISSLITGLFFVLLAHLLAVTYYQYSFDFDLIKLHDSSQPSYKAHRPSGSNLTASMSEAKRRLDQLASSAFLHQTMTIECVYVSLAIFALLIYFMPLIYHYFLYPFDFRFVRELLEPDRELNCDRRSLERIVADFMESSRMFSISRASVVHRSNKFGQKKLRASLPELRPGESSNQATVVTMKRYEAKLEKLLHEMLDRSALTPLNKRAIDLWPLKRSSVQLLCHLSFAFYSILFDALIIWGSFLWPNSGSNHEKLHLSQGLAMLSGAGLLIINMPSVSLLAPVYFVAAIDQIWFVDQLIKLIRRCIEANRSALVAESHPVPKLDIRAPGAMPAAERALAELPKSKSIVALQRKRKQLSNDASSAAILDTTLRRTGDATNTMDSNLIFVLLHHRIFVEQFEPVRVALKGAVTVSVALMFLMPIILRIHLDYIMQIHVNLVSASAVRWSAVGLSSTVLLPANFIIMPLCHLNSRCKKLYKTLSSLMAHIVQIRAHPMGTKLYDEHSVTVLHKELSHPDWTTNHFIIRSPLLSGTYATLIRAHFWWGFLVISILIDYQIGERNDSLILALMSDPFGLYS